MVTSSVVPSAVPASLVLAKPSVFRIPLTVPNGAMREACALDCLYRLLKQSFYKPDLQAIRVVLGAIQAHRLNVGDPAWLFVVAPPGSGKTTTSIMGTCGLPEVTMLGDFSENTFLSGFFGHKEPGILEKLGTTTMEGRTSVTNGNGVFVAKDFTTVLSMRREKRGAILSQLREIHDGEFKRDFGTGESKIWRGRVTIIAAVTPVLDQYYAVFSVLGERFLQVRWHRPDSEVAGVRAIQQQGKEAGIRKEIQGATWDVFEKAGKVAPVLSKEAEERLASLAEIIALGRTHIQRNGFGSREIEYVPEAEANTRISKGLAAIARGIASLHGRLEVAEDDLQDCFRVGLDCLTEYRRKVFMAVAEGDDPATVAIPKTMRSRALEDLEALHILKKSESNGYELDGRIARLLRKADVK